MKYTKILEQENYDTLSTSLFPGLHVKIYPSMRKTNSKKVHLCRFCGNRILEGEPYFTYRPILWITETKMCYVLNPSLILKESSQHFIPETISELENIYDSMSLFEQELYDSSELYPNHLNLGVDHLDYNELLLSGGMHIKKLGKKR